MNPWLQRFLISWAAGIVTTTAVVQTAKRPHKLKKKKRKKAADGTPEPVQIGQVALKDARLPEERGLTVGEWRDLVVERGQKIAAVFKRKEPAPSSADGAREPDEVQAKDGTVAKQSGKKKRKGKHAKGRRGKRRPQASLWDSAKQSFKDTVKEAAREEIKESPMGSAFEKLKTVGAKVKEGATAAASTAAKAVNNAIEKAKESSVAADAAGASANSDEEGPEILPPEKVDDAEALAPRVDGDVEKRDPVKSAGEVVAEKLDAVGSAIEKGVRNVADSVSSGGPPDIAKGAAEVGKKVKEAANVVGSWLQGPGSGYDKKRRPKGDGDVVEAKDADAPPAREAPDTTPPTPADAEDADTQPPTMPPPSAEAADTKPPEVAPGDEPVRGEVVDDGGDKAAQ